MDVAMGRVDSHLTSVAQEHFDMKLMKLSLRQLPGNLSEREVGVVFRKEDASMASRIERINEAIGAILANGTIGHLTERWLDVDIGAFRKRVRVAWFADFFPARSEILV